MILMASTTCTLSPTRTLSLGKVGAAAWGQSSTSEPTIIAKTDNILLNDDLRYQVSRWS